MTYGAECFIKYFIIYLASTLTEKSVKDTEVKTDSTVMQSQVGNERKELIQKKNI